MTIWALPIEFKLKGTNTFSFNLWLCRCSHIGIVPVSWLLLLLIRTCCRLQTAAIIVVVWLRFELLIKWYWLTFIYFVSWIILLSSIRKLRLWELISLGSNYRRRIFSLILFWLLLLVEDENLPVLRWWITVILLLLI